MDFEALKKEVDQIVLKNLDDKAKLYKICELLKNNVDHYDWVGFYIVNREKELILGPFVGEDTEHKKIKFGQGICGQAAANEQTFVVEDVTKEVNYLACSPKVLSEIVVPIFRNKKVVGEIDIDSHKINPFTLKDQRFLEYVADIVKDIV